MPCFKSLVMRCQLGARTGVPKARPEGSQGQERAKRARSPWIRNKKFRPAGPTDNNGAPLSPLRGSRAFLSDPGAACSLRFALAPGYLLAAPAALRYLLAAPAALRYLLAAPAALRYLLAAPAALRYFLTAPAALPAKFAWLLFMLCAFGWMPAMANEPTQIANYNIRAQLDVNSKVVTGSEEISWTNTTDDQLSELQFHLYMNAFKDAKSTYMKERGGISATFKGWGSVEVKKITLSDGTDLTSVQEFIHPDDDNAADQTVMRVPLPKPVAPGETLRLNIEFVTKLPRILARSGFRGDYFFVGQWYPKLGVYEKPKGAEKGAWNCHQYHLTSEYYADFGSYNVQLTVPSNYVVGATGELVASQADTANKTTTYTYAQNEVHDFAWSTSPRFQRIERTFDPSSEVAQGELEAAARLLQVPPSELSLTPVKVTLLLQPEHLNQAERHWDTIKKLIKFFGLRFGRYPYKTFTLVDTPQNAGGGGMEYPTLVTTDTRWLWSENTKDLEGLIAHEFAHQYWYGLVANNEFEHALLDEGFANYTTVLFTETAYGKDYNGLPLYLAGAPIGWLFRPFPVSETEFNRAIYLMDPKGDAGGKPTWQYADDFSYSLNNAFKFSLILKTLENHLGEQTMARVMRTYFDRWRFRHPKPQDFFDVVHEVSGQDLKEFYAQAVYGSNVLDYAIEGISSDSGDDGVESEVVVRRLGELVFPVTIKVTFDDGQTAYSEWDGKDRSTKIKFVRPAAVKWAQVDPENKILLDVNLANNSKSVESNHLVAAGISAKLLFWLQTALQSLTAVA